MRKDAHLPNGSIYSPRNPRASALYVLELILKHLKVWDPQPDTRMQRPFSTHSASTTR